MNKAGYAIELFNKGFNCSQSVFCAFCGDFGVDAKIGLKMACSFGAGMGYMGQACGAVTGAFMVLGLIYGQNDEEDKYSNKDRNEPIKIIEYDCLPIDFFYRRNVLSSIFAARQ